MSVVTLIVGFTAQLDLEEVLEFLGREAVRTAIGILVVIAGVFVFYKLSSKVIRTTILKAKARAQCVLVHVRNLIIFCHMLLKLMNEYSLHSAIKNWYSLPGDKFEVRIDDFIVDIVRGPLLIEIQTKNFSAIKKKLTKLLENHKVQLVYPIPQQKWIVHVTESGEIVRRRKSPKKGRLFDLFYELVRTPTLIKEENFSLEILMIEEEEVRCNDGKGSWRRRGVSIKDRKLMNVNGKTLFKNEKDFLRFLPSGLIKPFTNKKLEKLSGVSINLARKITYCLRKMGTITNVGKEGKELIFEVS